MLSPLLDAVTTSQYESQSRCLRHVSRIDVRRITHHVMLTSQHVALHILEIEGTTACLQTHLHTSLTVHTDTSTRHTY
jgi:hypothetical protein